MVEDDEVMSAVPKQGFKVVDTRDPSKAVNEKTINFLLSRIQLKHFVAKISYEYTRTSLPWIKEDKFILE